MQAPHRQFRNAIDVFQLDNTWSHFWYINWTFTSLYRIYKEPSPLLIPFLASLCMKVNIFPLCCMNRLLWCLVTWRYSGQDPSDNLSEPRKPHLHCQRPPTALPKQPKKSSWETIPTVGQGHMLSCMANRFSDFDFYRFYRFFRSDFYRSWERLMALV